MSMYYTFRSSRGAAVTVLRGEGPPQMVGGGGGWEIEARPRRVGLTIWKGREPYAMDVPVLFDGWRIGRSQENAISVLNQMQMGSDLQEPPTVNIEGGVPVKGIDWVIREIEWGTNVIYDDNDGGQEFRLRQDAVVHLIQYNPEDRFKIMGKGNLQAPSMYRVRQGDDFRSISQLKYGTPTKWKNIMVANKIRDYKKINKLVGKLIRIPPR